MGNDTPWIRGSLKIRGTVLEAIRRHAEEAYPSESCGFVTGPSAVAPLLDEAVPAENEADKYHAHDPERFPRTSRTYFKINEAKAIRLFEQGREGGAPVKVIYHSHCDAGAYFSEEDAATFSFNDRLAWPCAFLVTSVLKGRADETKLWVFDEATGGFVASDLTVVE